MIFHAVLIFYISFVQYSGLFSLNCYFFFEGHLTATYHQCYLIFSSLHGSYEKISHSKMGYDVPVL